MNTELAVIFTDSTAEFNNIQSPSPSIDFTDSPLPPSLIGPFTANPNFLVTAPVGQVGYYEIQFHLANNFWGCPLNFGNAVCGVQIRQAIAHMIDKASFTANQASIAGITTPIDNPVPTTSAGGLLSPNPCGYDASFPQGVNGVSPCIVGSFGGTSYHLAAAAGANGVPWLPAPGSPDLNAAAQHLVNAGIAAGFAPATSILFGVVPAAAANAPLFFIRTDDTARLDLGNSLAEEICYLFTGLYTVPCADLTVSRGPAAIFPGFTTSKTAVNLNWGMYTAAYSYVPFFDNSLYFTYNSRFVSGIPSIQPPNGPCSAQAVPTNIAANYMYLCSPTYDSLSTQMEAGPCLAAPGDPASGAGSNLPTPPGNGLCTGTSQLSAISAGIQTEAYFGANVFTLPIFERTVQFGYLNNGWTRAVNNNDVGLPNYFTWLNTYNPTPTLAGTIRQGFSQGTKSVNPFIASTPQDTYLVRSVYDSLNTANPLDPSHSIYWMVANSELRLANNSLPYTPPSNTVTTYRFTLRNDVFFQDAKPVTAFDIVFSYLNMVASGGFLGAGASSITGITVLNSRQFDINVNSPGPFVLPSLTSVPILPGRYWTNAGTAAWDSALSSFQTLTCLSNDPLSTFGICFPTQFTLINSAGSTPTIAVSCVSPAVFPCVLPAIFTTALMTANPADLSAGFDPISNHIFVGSGGWTCGTVTISGSGSCTPTGTMMVPIGSSWTLTRFGVGLPPASSINSIYFRSSGNLALWIWAGPGAAGPGILSWSSVVSCFGMPVNLNGPCAHWQQGIGSTNGIGGPPAPVNVNQVAIVNRFYGLNWVAPYNWAASPPLGIGTFPPVIYEGSVTLNPAIIAGCPNGYDC